MDVFIDQPWLIDPYIIILGLILGSFASALTYRLPRQRAWLLEEIGEVSQAHNATFWTGLKSRSRCTSCQTILGARDLIPFFSFVFSGGKCRHCKSFISRRYPIMEVVTACMLWLIYAQLGFSVTSILLMISLPLMMASMFIDLEFLILPDELTASFAVLALINLVAVNFFTGFQINPIENIAVQIACGLFYGFFGWAMRAGFHKVTGKEGLGLGDVKLFAVAGLWLGWGLMPFYLLLACFMGLIVGGLWRILRKEALFPFGPALILSVYLVILYRDFFNNLL
jgi:leader peptidase (prepilin peptidase)/N-methyltransferase